MYIEVNQVRGIKPPINLHFRKGSSDQIIQCKFYRLNEQIPISKYTKIILYGEGFEVKGRKTDSGLVEFIVPATMTSLTGCNVAYIKGYSRTKRNTDQYEFNYITEDINTNGKPFIVNHNCYPCNYMLTRLVKFNTLLDEEIASLTNRIQRIMGG